MSIKFVSHQRPNPMDRNAPRKFYPFAKSTGSMNLKQISHRIAAMSTVNSADVLAVLDLLIQVMNEEVANGHNIDLGSFGSFRVFISGSGSDTAQDVTASSILSARLKFRPGEDLKNMLKTLKFEKLSTPPVA